MPLWRIYHSQGTFADRASKQALSQAITDVYVRRTGMPAFFVVVSFVSLGEADVFVGGDGRDARNPFVRIVATQIHVRMPDDDAYYRGLLDDFDRAMKPHIEDRGWDWEYHIEETDRRLWKINGIGPPESKSEEERAWAKANRALPRTL